MFYFACVKGEPRKNLSEITELSPDFSLKYTCTNLKTTKANRKHPVCRKVRAKCRELVSDKDSDFILTL